MKKSVIAIIGPTAVGKTTLSIELAERFQGEIISGDSMQIYKKMNIGTAKITSEEMKGIPHHMINIKEPDEEFSVAEFQSLVQHYINDITLRNKLPMIVGGSGLYIQAALFDFNFSDQKRDERVTKKLEEEIEKNGIMPLYKRLTEIDPVQAKKIHPNNKRRVIRALEVYETTGMTITEYQKRQTRTSPYHLHLIGLEMDREQLYERINNRVDQMMEQGLLQEVEDLYRSGFENCQSMQAIGYKEFIPYFKGERTLEEAILLLKRNSRRYAKRQYTWFKNKMDVHWYSVTPSTIHKKFEEIFKDLAGFLQKK